MKRRPNRYIISAPVRFISEVFLAARGGAQTDPNAQEDKYRDRVGTEAPVQFALGISLIHDVQGEDSNAIWISATTMLALA